MAAKTFWLSFCDSSRPKGDQFLGVAVVDVNEEDAAEALMDLLVRFPLAQEGAEWIAAAVRKAHETGCNPGGAVASLEMPPEWPHLDTCPRNVLLTKARLFELELV